LKQTFILNEESPDAGEPEATHPDAPSGAEPTGGRYQRTWLAFRRWRRTRPFWAGLLCLLGGAIIAYGPLSVIHFILVAGTVVWAGILMGILICIMGLFMWFTPQFRQILGILAALFAVVSLVTSNYGGFLIGLLLGVLGGGMGFAWTPLPDQPVQVGSAPTAPEPPSEPDARETPPAPEPQASSTAQAGSEQRLENGSPASDEDPAYRHS
jgi:hypothetical protein